MWDNAHKEDYGLIPGIRELIWQRDVKLANRIKAVNQLTLRATDYLELSG